MYKSIVALVVGVVIGLAVWNICTMMGSLQAQHNDRNNEVYQQLLYQK